MKKNKKEFYDDGRTIVDMHVEGMPSSFRKDSNRKKEYDVSKEEKKHLIFASYKAMLPVLLCGIIGMLLAMLLIMWWLKAL